jgi:hypothetical protein
MFRRHGRSLPHVSVAVAPLMARVAAAAMVVALADMDLGFSERLVEIGFITQEFLYGLRMFAVRGAHAYDFLFGLRASTDRRESKQPRRLRSHPCKTSHVRRLSGHDL